MPAINKIRVTNVNFKNNTRRYDDLTIPVNGNNSIIDGENGDGKTLFTQCAFQTIIPNSYFHHANKIERLFTDNNNSVIHSMIEWELDKGNEHDFMITGFCAKDIQKDKEEASSPFEYFTYAILYKHSFKFSVESIPLKTEKDGKSSIMGYKQLKEHLRKLNEAEKNCVVKIFSSKKDYLNFLYNYGINEAEWKLLFNTNRQEGGAEHYFTTKFKTPKDLITNEIVPLIESIDKYRLGDSMSNEQLAKSLLDINKTIKQLTEKSQRLNELNIAETSLNKVVGFNNELKKAFEDKDATYVEIVKGYNKELAIIKEIEDTISEIKSKEQELEDASNNIRVEKEEIQNKINLKNEEKDQLDLDLKEVDSIEKILNNRARKDSLIKEAKLLETEKLAILSEMEELEGFKANTDAKIKELKNSEVLMRAENIYLEYKDSKSSAQQKQLKLDNFNRSNNELLAKKKEAESMYLYALNKLEGLLNDLSNELTMTLDGIDEDIKLNNANLVTSNTKLNTLKLDIENKNKEIESFEKSILNISDKEDKVSKDNEQLISEISNLITDIENDKNTDALKGYISRLKSIVEGNKILDINKDFVLSIHNELNAIYDNTSSNIDKLKNERTLLENDTLKTKLESNIEKLQSDIKLGFEEERDLLKEIDELKTSISSNNYKIETVSKLLDSYNSDMETLEPIIAELKVNDRFECEKELYNKSSNLKNESFSIDTKINELNYKLKDLKNNEGLSLDKKLIENFKIVSDSYKSAMLGRDFIKPLSIDEKDLYLSKTTLIPYSIILDDKDYNSLLKNATLKDKMGDFLTPIINITAIKNLNRLDDSTIYFNTLSKESFIDEAKILEEINKVELELSKLQSQSSNIKEELNNIEKLLKTVSLINSKYDQNFKDDKSKEIIDLKESNMSTEKNIESKNELIAGIEEQRKSKYSFIENIKEEIAKHELHIKEEIAKLNKAIDLLQEDILFNKSQVENLNKIESKAKSCIFNLELLKEYSEEIETLRNKITANNNAIIETNSSIKNIELEIKSLETEKVELEEVKKSKENLYADNKLKLKETNSYKSDIPVGTVEKETDLTVDELREQVKIFNRNYEREYSQMEELEREIKVAHDNCLKKKSEIELLKVSFNDLDSRKDLITYNGTDEFESIATRLSVVNTELNNIMKSIIEADRKKIATETTIANKLKDAENIDTQDDVVIAEDYSVEENRSRINGLIKTVKLDIKNLNAKFKECSDIEYDYIAQLRDLGDSLNVEQDKLRKNETYRDNTLALINANKINLNLTDEAAESITFVIREASKKIEWHNKTIGGIKVKHEREIQETYDKLENSVFEFISVLKEILPPNNIDEVDMQNNNITANEGYLYYLNQEKDSINQELEDLYSMKTEFINKCVHNVESLIEKLKKLSKQSTVVLNDKKIELIQLKLYELSSEQKIEKMTKHIDNLLENIDEDDIEKSTLLLNNELTASKLLEQGVKNIRNCEVNIYIPDSIRIEEGYYEKWGGGASSGQRNIMYFTTVLALIVFIRESSSLNGASQQTKVLFGDGPFRGAAALYLWEPVFKMMQENNIQFLVTNYATAPHLTNLFSSRAMLAGVETQLNGKRIIKNELRMDSVFKENTKSLRGENLLVKYEDYKIPTIKKTIVKETNVDDSQMSLLDDMWM